MTALVLRSQLVMFGTLVFCTALMPGFLFSRDMGGVSNYGVQPLTVVPYSLGTVAAVWLLWLAGTRALTLHPRRVGLLARAAAICLAVNLATTYPYKSSPSWAMVHSWTAIGLALVEFLGGLALSSVAVRGGIRWVARVLLVIGFSCLVLTYVGRLHVLFVAEVTTAAAFGLALYAAAPALTERQVERAAADPPSPLLPGQLARELD